MQSGSIPHAGQNRALWFSTIAFHCELCCLDDLFHYRHPDQDRVGVDRDPVRAPRWNTDFDGFPCASAFGNMDRSVRRPHRLCLHNVGGGARDLVADVCDDLSANADCSAWRRRCRRLLCCRRRLCIALVSDRKAGHGAWHFRSRQCRSRGHQVSRTIRSCRLWLACGGAGVGFGHCCHGGDFLVRHRRRSGPGSAPCAGRQTKNHHGRIRAAEEYSGLAVLDLLFLRIRRVCGACFVAAALSHRRLRREHHDGRHAWRRLLDTGQHIPCLRRSFVRQIRRAQGDVLDIHRVGDHHVHSVLSTDAIYNSRHTGADHVPHGNGGGCLHSTCFCARFFHELGQGRSL